MSYVQERGVFFWFSFFPCRFELGCFLFRAHVFSLGLKGDVCFFLPFLERGCNFLWGKQRKSE